MIKQLYKVSFSIIDRIGCCVMNRLEKIREYVDKIIMNQEDLRKNLVDLFIYMMFQLCVQFQPKDVI